MVNRREKPKAKSVGAMRRQFIRLHRHSRHDGKPGRPYTLRRQLLKLINAGMGVANGLARYSRNPRSWRLVQHQLPVSNVYPLFELAAYLFEVRHFFKSKGFVQRNAGDIGLRYPAYQNVNLARS